MATKPRVRLRLDGGSPELLDAALALGGEAPATPPAATGQSLGLTADDPSLITQPSSNTPQPPATTAKTLAALAPSRPAQVPIAPRVAGELFQAAAAQPPTAQTPAANGHTGPAAPASSTLPALPGVAFGEGLSGVWRLRAPPAELATNNVGASEDVASTAAQPLTPNPAAPLITRILRNRGIADDTFLTPKLTGLHDPALLHDIDRAAERIIRALRLREPIVIYGDYDVDGITASTILYHMLVALEPAANVRTYVPHRLEEGYGLNPEAIEALAKGEDARDPALAARVIITVDCGIGAIVPASRAKALGVDLIITDHHNPPATEAELPEAYAIIHPRRPGSVYPFGDLCGAGVAFKLAWRLATTHFGSSKLPQPLRELLLGLLPFAALGTVADIMPLIGENRIITSFGLRAVKASPNAGLKALVRAARLETDKVSALDVGFKMGPRLNACGRMGHASEAVELFTRASPERAAAIAESLEQHNEARRITEQKIAAEATAMAIERGDDRPEVRGIVLASPSWHIGVVGIVCSRLVERFCKPVILLGQRDGHWHGSGRSIAGVSLHSAIAQAAEHTIRFGGHDMAAGLALADDQLTHFTTAFQAACKRLVTEAHMKRTITIDAIAEPSELAIENAQAIGLLEPCGMGNPAPLIAVLDAELYQIPRPLGSSGHHVLLTFKVGQRFLTVKGWSWAAKAALLRQGSRYDLVVRLGINEYLGKRTVEGELRDLREAQPMTER